MSEWINAKDKLPELRQRVLVAVPGIVSCDIGMIVGTAERQISNPPETVWELWGMDHRTTDVTHWMPLPERPKQEGPFSWKDSDRRELLFRENELHDRAIVLHLTVAEYAMLRDWLNDIWAKCKP